MRWCGGAAALSSSAMPAATPMARWPIWAMPSARSGSISGSGSSSLFNIKRTALPEETPAGKLAKDDACYCAVGRIVYPEADAPPGYLLYIKPMLYGNEPVDILSYAAESPTFPHELTADQWFSESQMESYRALGSYVVNRIWERISARSRRPGQSRPRPSRRAGLRSRPDDERAEGRAFEPMIRRGLEFNKTIIPGSPAAGHRPRSGFSPPILTGW